MPQEQPPTGGGKEIQVSRARFDNWQHVTERDDHLPYEPTDCDRQMADRIREAIETHVANLNARQPHIERNARKGSEL